MQHIRHSLAGEGGDPHARTVGQEGGDPHARTVADDGRDPHARIDLDRQYRLLAGRLRRAVGAAVRAPDSVIEEACQQAWLCLVVHAERVSAEAVFPWLLTTARRCALKQLRADSRARPLELVEESGREASGAGGRSPEEVLAARDLLDAIKGLPERQQRLLWLRGAGLSYEELAAHEGCTKRTVERQLLRARQGVRLADAA